MKVVHHKDGDPRNNDPANLEIREASRRIGRHPALAMPYGKKAETKYNPPPWTNELTPLIPADDPRVLLNGNPPRTALRVLAEENFQLAKHAVNNHEALVAVLKYWMFFIESEAGDPKQKPWVEKARAALAKAKES
jgi:hypothetical protein